MKWPYSAGWRWKPAVLGRSLPFYRRLWLARGLLAAIAGFFGLWLGLAAWSALEPDVDELAPADAEGLVIDQLTRLEPRPWAPGSELGRSAAPDWLPVAFAQLRAAGHPSDPPLGDAAQQQAQQARADFAAGNYPAAATRFLRARQGNEAWWLTYNSAISLLRHGDIGRARDESQQATKRLAEYQTAGADSVEHFALRALSHLAEGQARLADGDCNSAIVSLRRLAMSLRQYVEREGAIVYDRKLPFLVIEGPIDSLEAWTALAHAYARCDDEYPGSYPIQPEKQSFVSEYDRADLEEVRQGPFAEGIAACVDNSPRPRSRCWAMSNLNKVLWVSRSYLPAGENEPTRLEARLTGSLARLVYNAAWLAATSGHEGDRLGAADWLLIAARLDRQAPVDGLAQRIGELGRHLAPLTGNYSLLAEPWRRRDLTQARFEQDMPDEAVKGLGWAMSERWIEALRAGRAVDAMQQIDQARIHLAGPFGDSLASWKRELRGQIHQALADAIGMHRRNGNLQAALAIRDYRADWLGEQWPDAASNAWRSGGMTARLIGLAVLWALICTGLWLLHRLVVFPYLVYSTDAYRLEYQLRQAQGSRLEPDLLDD